MVNQCRYTLLWGKKYPFNAINRGFFIQKMREKAKTNKCVIKMGKVRGYSK